jgi:hypothetical protein
VTTEVTARRFRLASPTTAVVLGGLSLALIATWVPLIYLTRDPQAARDGLAPVFALACGLVGMLVARRQARNPEGWLLLGLAVGVIAVLGSGLYAVLDYRLHHGLLPLGETAVFIHDTMGQPITFVFPLVILLFPDGRLSRRWSMGVVVVSGPGRGARGGRFRRRGRQPRRAAHPGRPDRGVLGAGQPHRCPRDAGGRHGSRVHLGPAVLARVRRPPGPQLAASAGSSSSG